MKVLITGVAGFIGSHLAEALLKEGHSVAGIDDFSNGNIDNIVGITDNENFNWYPYSIKESLPFKKLWQDVEIIYHLACAKNRLSDVNPYACIETNVRQTMMLYKKAESIGVKKVVHSSTGSIYGDHGIKPIDESSKSCPVSFYGINKLAGESYARMFNFDFTVLRYFHVYGLRGSGVVNKFINLHKAGKPLEIWGDGEQIRCFTHVSDVVKANMTAPLGTWNVCSGIKVKVNDLIKILAEVSGLEPEVIYKPALKNDITNFTVLSSLPIAWKKDIKKEIEILWKL